MEFSNEIERVAEAAKSGRSRCGACGELIPKGDVRVGVRRWSRFRSKSEHFFLATKWYHEQCDPSTRESTIAACGKVPVVTASFTAAARNAVRGDILKFREGAFSDGNPLCPISGKALTQETSHVHHFGPEDFKSIVDSFVKEKLLDSTRLSFTSDHQFCDGALENEFREYHRNKSKFLLVHKTVNLSTLKKNPTLGPCSMCSRPRRLTWVFSEGVCTKCRKAPEHRQKYLSQRQCMKFYGLNPDDLKTLQCQRMDNPISASFSPMKLYQKSAVEAAASIKFGNAERALQLCSDRRTRRLEARKNVYDRAREFSMDLRQPRRMLVSDVADLEPDMLATTTQLRLLMQLGIETDVGVSKVEASALIGEDIRKRKEKRKRR
mmetsp:Transcript_6886/g.14050  ORF Transcript_6886/g.14050 Transcript_6886/m.14050 type:complete len:379 (+) Transcript_6886:86-1222(+)